MGTINFVLYVVVFFILIKFFQTCVCQRDGLVARPNDVKREAMVATILKNKNIFVSDTMDIRAIRYYMPWMDAVVYEDIRKLCRSGKFFKKNIYDVLG